MAMVGLTMNLPSARRTASIKIGHGHPRKIRQSKGELQRFDGSALSSVIRQSIGSSGYA
jgi:hypothetical protein